MGGVNDSPPSYLSYLSAGCGPGYNSQQGTELYIQGPAQELIVYEGINTEADSICRDQHRSDLYIKGPTQKLVVYEEVSTGANCT